MIAKLQVRVISPWFGELETPEAFFSVKIPSEKADALLCDWMPDPELFTFPGRKAWYCCEPKCQFRVLGGGTWPFIRARLASREFLFHSHPDPRLRVPVITHFEKLIVNRLEDRKNRAVAVVSNHGGLPWRRHSDLKYRNRFITHPTVDLYGREGWKSYRAGWLARPAPPSNYRGALPGDWPASGKRALMARYKVAICLENMIEPYFFTEKFVEAVCAGCIPVYRAHPTIAQTILRDAAWVDPANYGHDPEATIKAALSFNAESIRLQNEQWLASAMVADTHSTQVFGRIGIILAGTLTE